MEDTRATLLSKIRHPGAHHAWEEFYRLYGPVILNFARKSGLDGGSGEDVLQETMIALLRIMPDFQYDKNRGRFRNLLIMIVRRKIIKGLRRKYALKEVSLADAGLTPEMLGEIPDESALPADKELDLLWQVSVREEALRRVARDFPADDRTFAVYVDYVQNGLAAKDVARNFGITPNCVYQIKNRVEVLLHDEMARLLKASGETGGP